MAMKDGKGRPAEAAPAPGTEAQVPSPSEQTHPSFGQERGFRLLNGPGDLTPERLADNE